MAYIRIMDKLGISLLLFSISLQVLTYQRFASACGTVMYTDKTDYRVGETIHLNCSVTSARTPPKPYEFRIVRMSNDERNNTIDRDINNGNQTISTIFRVRNFTGITEIRLRSIYDEGTYICYYGNCRDILLTSFERIYISRDVSTLRRPIMTCVSDSLWNMTCHWSTQQSDVVFMYKITFKREDSPVEHCCGGKQDCDTFTINNYCVIPYEQFTGEIYYYITLQIKSREDKTQSFTYTVKANNSMVRLHIEELIISAPSLRELQWMATSDLAPLSVGEVKCLVTVRSQWEGDKPFNARFISNSSSLRMTGVLSNLHPYTRYDLKLTCRPSDSSYWSNVLTASDTTLPEPPDDQPLVYGYSTFLTGEGTRDIILYMQSLLKRFYNDKTAFYTVDMDIFNSTISQTFAASSSSAYLNVSLKQNQTATILMTTVNGEGESNSTLFEIPPTGDHTPPRIVVVELKTSNLTDVSLFGFDILQTTSRLCFFTCKARDEWTPPLCLGQLEKQCIANTTMLKKSTFTQIHTVGDETTKLTFGVSTETDSTKSQHITWSDCIFKFKDRYKDFKLPVTVTKVNTTSINVTLNFEYCRLPRRPILYQITTRTENENICNFEASQNNTATPDMSQIQMNIDDLDMVSDVCFRAVYENETHSITYFATFDKYDAVVQYKTSETEAGVGIAAGITLCGVLLLLLGLKKYRRRLQSKSLVKDIFLDLLPPDSTIANPTERHVTEGSFRKITSEPPSHYDYVEDVTTLQNTDIKSKALSSYEKAIDIDITGHFSDEDVCVISDTNNHTTSKENDVRFARRQSTSGQCQNDIICYENKIIGKHASSFIDVINTSDNSGLTSGGMNYMLFEGTNSCKTNSLNENTYVIDTANPNIIELTIQKITYSKSKPDSRKHSTESLDKHITKRVDRTRKSSTTQNGESENNEHQSRTNVLMYNECIDSCASSTSESETCVDSYSRVTLPIDSGDSVSNYVTMAHIYQ